jgi:hypothetical protein
LLPSVLRRRTASSDDSGEGREQSLVAASDSGSILASWNA